MGSSAWARSGTPETSVHKHASARRNRCFIGAILESIGALDRSQIFIPLGSFLHADAMLFASLFAGYVMLRAGAATWPDRFSGFPWLETAVAGRRQRRIRRVTNPLDREPRAWLDVRRDQAGHRCLDDRQRRHTHRQCDAWRAGTRSRGCTRFTCSPARSLPAGWPVRRSEWRKRIAIAGWRASRPPGNTGSSSTLVWLFIVTGFYVWP